LIPITIFASTRGKTMLAFDNSIAAASSISSKSMQIETYEDVALHFVYPAGSTGTCNMEVSNDKVNWVEVSGSILALGDGNDIINKANLGSKWIRSSCTASVNIANMKIYIGAK